jgi:hypothetical protein
MYILYEALFQENSFYFTHLIYSRDRRGHDRMVVGFTTLLPMQSVSITTKLVSSNLDQGEVCNIM